MKKYNQIENYIYERADKTKVYVDNGYICWQNPDNQGVRIKLPEGVTEKSLKEHYDSKEHTMFWAIKASIGNEN